MTSPSSRDAFRNLLAEVVAARPSPLGPHVADDDDRLARWSAGYLSPDECREITDHLAACSRCSTLVAGMIKCGALSPPLSIEETQESAVDVDRQANTSPRSAGAGESGDGRWRPLYIASLAAAAALVAAFVYFGGGSNSVENQIAMAEQELTRGASLDALQRLESLLGRSLPDDSRAKAISAAERAAERAAVERLGKGDFPQVIEIAARADRLGAASDQVLNAELQALRGDSSVVSLGRSGTLLDYGYDVQGNSSQKSFLTFDPQFERQRTAWQEAIAKHPNSLLLPVNFGQFLLQAGAIELAEAQFNAALAIQSASVEARLGLGLARFERQDFAGALETFESILRDEPKSASANVNAAIACQKLKRLDDARRYWQQARTLTSDPLRREEIDQQLLALPEK